MFKIFDKNLKIPKDITWLVPGMQVKRWLFAIFFGVTIATLGILILLDLQPILTIMEWIKTLAKSMPSEIIAWIFIIIGALVFFLGWKNANYSILDVRESRDKNALIDTLYRRRKLNKGPKIVAIGEIGLDYYWDKSLEPYAEKTYNKQYNCYCYCG